MGKGPQYAAAEIDLEGQKVDKRLSLRKSNSEASRNPDLPVSSHAQKPVNHALAFVQVSAIILSRRNHFPRKTAAKSLSNNPKSLSPFRERGEVRGVDSDTYTFTPTLSLQGDGVVGQPPKWDSPHPTHFGTQYAEN